MKVCLVYNFPNIFKAKDCNWLQINAKKCLSVQHKHFVPFVLYMFALRFVSYVRLNVFCSFNHILSIHMVGTVI